MSEISAKRSAAPVAKQALFLLFRIGNERYALRATEVAEVLPRLPLKPIARAPQWVAGVFAYRGAVVPVIDLSALTFGQPAEARTSTRLVLVHYRRGRVAAGAMAWADSRAGDRHAALLSRGFSTLRPRQSRGAVPRPGARRCAGAGAMGAGQ